MASRWQTSTYNNRRKGWTGSLFEKTAIEVSAANNIGRLPKTLDAVQSIHSIGRLGNYHVPDKIG